MSEITEQLQAIVDAEQPNAEPVKETEQLPATETAEEEPAKPAEEPKADKTFTQAELDRIVQKEKAKIERRIERQLAEKTQPAIEQKPVVQALEKPKEDDFSDYGSYLEALADFKADQKITERENAKQQQEIEIANKAYDQRQSDLRRSLMESGEDKYDDFEEVLQSSKLRLADPAYLAILESPISADLAYFLCKNDEESERIIALPPYAQAKEIGKLEDKLTAKQPIKKSDAPKPISPVNTSRDFTKRLEDMTVAEYEADARKRGSRYI